MRFAVMALVWSGCATAQTICPTGTKLITTTASAGRAQWCTTTNSVANQPATGRSFATSLGMARPPAMSGLEGPFTSWHPNGSLHAHGSYTSYGSRSVPEGLWAFWHDNGQRSVIGVYHRGLPVGCFAVWDEHGARQTGTVQGDELHVEPCTPPSDDDLLAIEGARPSVRPTSVDISVQSFLGPNELGASTADQVSDNLASTAAFSGTVRKHLGRLRVGPTAGIRLGDNSFGKTLHAGGTAGWRLPSLHPRVAAEISAELSVQRIDLTAQRRSERGIATVVFWSPLPAVQTGVELALSPSLAALASVRVEGLPSRDVDRDVRYCDLFCADPVRETWQIGGFNYGITVGLRMLLR